MPEKIYGYYDRADQPIEQPTINPAFDAPCLFCDKPLTEDDMRTHSIMPIGSSRSYFYRTHRTCHESASSQRNGEITDFVFDSVKHHGD